MDIVTFLLTHYFSQVQFRLLEDFEHIQQICGLNMEVSVFIFTDQ